MVDAEQKHDQILNARQEQEMCTMISQIRCFTRYVSGNEEVVV